MPRDTSQPANQHPVSTHGMRYAIHTGGAGAGDVAQHGGCKYPQRATAPALAVSPPASVVTHDSCERGLQPICGGVSIPTYGARGFTVPAVHAGLDGLECALERHIPARSKPPGLCDTPTTEARPLMECSRLVMSTKPSALPSLHDAAFSSTHRAKKVAKDGAVPVATTGTIPRNSPRNSFSPNCLLRAFLEDCTWVL
jgi:hypothetical protein